MIPMLKDNFNKISMAYMDRSWPTYGDDIGVDEFTENLKKKISEVPGMG